MKRQTVMISCAFLVIMLAIGLINPSRASATPGNVTIQGQVTYQPRNWDPQKNNWRTGNEIQINLYERDSHQVEHLLDTIYTDKFGYFQFPSRTNWWAPDNTKLNIFYRIVTVFPYTYVTDTLSRQYAFDSEISFLSTDGTVIKSFAITSSWTYYQAIWIFEDLRNAWNFVHDNDFRNGVQYNPGNVKALWEPGVNCYLTLCTSYTNGAPIDPWIFIADNSNNSMDVVVHEVAHMFVVNANGWWYVASSCSNHHINTSTEVNCAWAEGWADFLPLPVNNDHCYNFTKNPCAGQADTDYFNLEVHNRGDRQNPPFALGDSVEGRVAAALYDLYDIYTNEGFDSISAGFAPISHISLGTSQITTFYDFWNNWNYSSGQSPFLSGLTLWWNSIYYVNIRQIFLPNIAK
jgi:hypothetical protein